MTQTQSGLTPSENRLNFESPSENRLNFRRWSKGCNTDKTQSCGVQEHIKNRGSGRPSTLISRISVVYHKFFFELGGNKNLCSNITKGPGGFPARDEWGGSFT